MSEFRKDINGLRALAVLFVVLYHFKIILGGGYIGVDIFFVISGYLMNEICKKSFGSPGWIIEFYKKRINRIYPALLFVVIVTGLVALIMLPPSFLGQVRNEVIAALTFTSNFYYLFSRSDYFSSVADSYILLHTWSLGVEFQFYLIFPFVLIIGNYKWFRKSQSFLFGILLVGSFICCVIFQEINAKSAFYFFPSRAWELFLGAFASSLACKNPIPKITQWVAIIILLVYGVWGLDTWAWPGFFTIVPTVATAAILHARVSNADTILRWNLAQKIGSSSYSVYLVHWPIISILFNIGITLDIYGKFIGVIASLGVGYLSYLFVEKRNKFVTKKAVLVTVAFTVFIFSANYLKISTFWTNPSILKLDDFLSYDIGKQQWQFGHESESNCFLTSVKNDVRFFNYEYCLAKADEKNLLLIGDSHAAHLSRAVRQVFEDYNVMQVTASGCLPFIHAGGAKYCTQLINDIYDNRIKTLKPDLVLISARWLLNEDVNNVFANIVNTVNFLEKQDIAVYIVGQNREFDMDLPRLMQIKGMENLSLYNSKKAQIVNTALGDLLQQRQVKYIGLYDIGCLHEKCIYIDGDGIPMLFDDNHFTYEWSVRAATEIRQYIEFSQNLRK